MKLYQIKTPTCRSVRDLLFIIVLVALASALVTYQLSKYLPIKPRTSVQVVVGNSMEIFENHLYSQRHFQYSQDKSQGLEGLFFEDTEEITRTEMYDERKDITEVSTDLLHHIKRVEDRLNFNQDRQERLALLNNVDKKVLTCRQALQSAGYDHTSDANETDDAFDAGVFKMQWNSSENNTLLPKNCHKISRIPALFEMVNSKEALCRTMKLSYNIPHFKDNPLSPTCYILPEENDEFFSYSRAHNQKLIIDSLLNSGRTEQPFEKNSKIPWSADNGVVVQVYRDNPLLIHGMPFEVRMYVLVTSLSPLRAYIHSKGIVQHKNDSLDDFSKISDGSWSLDQLKDHFVQMYGSHIATVAIRNINSVIIQTLLFFDAKHTCERKLELMNGEFKEQSKFQLLKFSVVLDTRFKPTILEIKPEVDTHSRSFIEDVAAMVTARGSVAVDVAEAIQTIDLHLLEHGTKCKLKKECLAFFDLEYILTLRREFINRGGFKTLYPNPQSDKYRNLLEQLHSSCRALTSRHIKNPPHIHAERHSTLELHSILLAITRYMKELDSRSSDIVPSSKDTRQSRFLESMNDNIDENIPSKHCSEEYTDISLLRSFETHPRILFTPQLNPNTTEYYATVPYDVIFLTVSARAFSCFCEARFDDKYGFSRPVNYTLGLGSNNIYIHIVDITHTRPWSVNTYTLHVYRESSGISLPHTGSTEIKYMKACSIVQDCDFIYIPENPCGLQPTKYNKWNTFQQHRYALPECRSGDTPGSWIVPCFNCSSSRLCDWSEATWQPRDCVHSTLSRNDLKTCLADRRIMFIGDSTNRGIMHYLMEQVNGTLTEWDKTHDMKFYKNLNEGKTSMSFAYYPQFWLTAQQRPGFEKTVHQLIQLHEPLENNRKTVIVVGGVHWLATHHLTVLQSVLHREGLADIQVIVKTIGAGFHQPVDGLHCLTMRDQRKLVRHNKNIIDLSHELNYDVVDTFNMTMSRYKDFLQGKCACHFHTVKEVLPSFSQLLKTRSSVSGEPGDVPITFHVEGDINRIYSEILISRICNDQEKNL